MRKTFILSSFLIGVLLTILSYYWHAALWSFIIIGPVFLIGFADILQKRHSILRNYPVLGHFRFLMEALRPEIYQYFIESDTNGTPFSRLSRSLIYQRAKLEEDTRPFGTELDVYAEGYEWINHSIAAIEYKELDLDLRVTVGGPQCTKPYSASVLNISAMSFGSLSANAVLALNGGAKLGNFAHNTGEGGLSKHHLEPGGDIIWQIGTGYFSCRHLDGSFDYNEYTKRSLEPQVKMIEIKLSQGAKPGHGGILPGVKVSEEIAKIRLVEPYKDVISPPVHTAFLTPLEMIAFIQKLRELSGGKPVGFKLCVGNKSEFISICKAMVKTGIYADFITVDGAEGGTGAAPLEFTNSVGMPLREALVFVYDTLVGFGIKQRIKIIASGKVSNGFEMVKNFAIGADMCNSARGMMFALGCIQALECNKNTCPTGVATQDQGLMKGLVISNKKVRVANFHRLTVTTAVQLIGAAGIKHSEHVNRNHIHRRISTTHVETYANTYPYLKEGCLLEPPFPEHYRADMERSSEHSFVPIIEHTNI